MALSGLTIRMLWRRDDHSVATREWEPWCEQTGAGFRSVTLPGGHFFNRVGRTMLIGIVVDELLGVLGAPSRREPIRS